MKRKRGLTAKVQYRREMILGYDEDASDDDTDHPQSNQAHLTLSELRTYGLGLARWGGGVQPTHHLIVSILQSLEGPQSRLYERYEGQPALWRRLGPSRGARTAPDLSLQPPARLTTQHHPGTLARHVVQRQGAGTANPRTVPPLDQAGHCADETNDGTTLFPCSCALASLSLHHVTPLPISFGL